MHAPVFVCLYPLVTKSFFFTVGKLVLCVGSHCWIENLNAEEFFIYFFFICSIFSYSDICLGFVFMIVERINKIDVNVKLI